MSVAPIVLSNTSFGIDGGVAAIVNGYDRERQDRSENMHCNKRIV